MILAILKALLIVPWILACTSICALLKRFYPDRNRQWIIRLCYQGLLRIVGIKLRIEGRLDSERPLLVVSNHSSYLDIVILGALLAPRFTPKLDVANWPVIGWICRVSDCIFIDRRPSKTPENQQKLRQAAAEGALISLFPEGTTSDGKRVLPFRSSYFRLAEECATENPLAIQPVAITYSRIRNLPIDSSQRPKIAWYGDMDLLPHVFGLLKLGNIEVKITFCETLRPKGDVDRKVLAAQCKLLINNSISAN